MAQCWALAATQVYQQDRIYISSSAIQQASRLTRMVGQAQAQTHGRITNANRFGSRFRRLHITVQKFIRQAINSPILPRRQQESLWMMALLTLPKPPLHVGLSHHREARKATRFDIPNRVLARQIARRVGLCQQVHRRASIHCMFASPL